SLALAPDDMITRCGIGDVQMSWGVYVQNGGGDPRPHFKKALSTLDEVLERAPSEIYGWVHRGNVRANLGRFLDLRGEDSIPLFKEAIKDYSEALRIDPSESGAWALRGGARDKMASTSGRISPWCVRAGPAIWRCPERTRSPSIGPPCGTSNPP
ncbi:MAG: tetratricopeptide repeat protein, partial [Planctomycetota bacterium]